MSALASQARADVIFSFNGTATSNVVDRPGSTPINVLFDLTDNTTQDSGYGLSGQGSGSNPIYTDGASKLISITINDGQIRSNYLFGSIYFITSFSQANSSSGATLRLAGTTLSFSGLNEELSLTNGSGYFGSDTGVCNGSVAAQTCSVTGSYSLITHTTAAVPEPATIALLAGTAVPLFFVRRRRKVATV